MLVLILTEDGWLRLPYSCVYVEYWKVLCVVIHDIALFRIFGGIVVLSSLDGMVQYLNLSLMLAFLEGELKERVF